MAANAFWASVCAKAVAAVRAMEKAIRVNLMRSEFVFVMVISFLKLFVFAWWLCFGDLCFLFVFGFHEGFQAIEICGPKDAVLLDPGVDGAKRFRIEFVNAVASLAMFSDQVRATQQAEVLGDCGTRDGEGFGDLSGGLAASSEKIEHGASSRICQGLEGGLGCLRGGICNRTVTHNA